MVDNFTLDLMWEAFAVGAVAFLLATRDMPVIVAALVTCFRFAIPTIYFGGFFHDGWILLDDLAYMEQGNDLLRGGFNPLSALSPDGFDQMRSLAGGDHVLYVWQNLLAQYLFGEHYYAPVFLNVLATFATAYILGRTADLLGFSRGYRQGLQVFYLLHWEIISWSSFLNLKDCIVQLLTVAALYCIARFYVRRDLKSILLFASVLPLFYWLRFYIPLLILGATAIWTLFQWKGALKYPLVAAMALAGYMMLPWIYDNAEFLNPGVLVFGTFHMLLTPLPWSLIEGYSFLTLSSICHLVFFLPAVYGTYLLSRAKPLARLYLIYLIIIIEIYAANEDLREPRHRFQIAFIFAWVQFHCLWTLRPQRFRQPASRVPATVGKLKVRPAVRPARAFA